MKHQNVEKLQNLIKDFYNLTGMKICIYDSQENELCFYPAKLSEFCASVRRSEELDRRYFTPFIKKINSVKDKFGYLYFDVVTTSGNVTFVLNNPFSNIRILEDGRIFINDIDGNVFAISSPSALDTASLKKIEIYL